MSQAETFDPAREVPGRPPRDAAARLAEHVASYVGPFMGNYLRALGFASDAVLELTHVAARTAVMRAFGCTCRDHSDDGAVYAEDVLCPVHRWQERRR